MLWYWEAIRTRPVGARARVVTLGGLIRTRPVGARVRVVTLGGLICSRPVGARARVVTLGGSSCSRPMMDILLASINGNLALICSSAELIRSKVNVITTHYLKLMLTCE